MTLTGKLPPFAVPADVAEILEACPSYVVAENIEQLVELSINNIGPDGWQDVGYDIPGTDDHVVEARVTKVRNGIAANYLDAYMRRRDPNCMVIGDDRATDKATYKSRFGESFDHVRQQTIDWLKTQDLAVLAFSAGTEVSGLDAIAICPANAGFFALGLAMLQGMMSPESLDETFQPSAVLYIAPPFRHSHFEGKQVVVHNRTEGLHELFSYNLYPGPSAKKGVYGMLLNVGESEHWVTAHCSTVQIVTPYDNTVTIMHEGASGGGKSEMLEEVHRERDGRWLLGQNVQRPDDKRHLVIPRTCDLHPVTDDMALCHPSFQKASGKLQLFDAENSWFMRVNHLTHYGTDPNMERLTMAPPVPLLFLNIYAVPDATALIWEHIEDEPGVPCPNPRVVIPREIVPKVVDKAVSVDIRSFGVRTPPCTTEHPTYGILGLLQILPPALGWLWRLVAPRGHGNPSIVSTEGMSSEGVGSYWPFATGRRVDQANLLLQQIRDTPKVRYVLIPNQHIGAWKVGFMPQWVAREYLARRGTAKFQPEQLTPARCPLAGYAMTHLMVEGQTIAPWMLRPELQSEIGPETYDLGAAQLREFFVDQLGKFLVDDLDPLGRKIIEVCLDNGTLADYEEAMHGESIFIEE